MPISRRYIALTNPDTQAYQILSLIALCGEFPASQISRIPGSKYYIQALLTELKRQQWIKAYSKDKISSYRLTSKARAYLLENNPARFQFYLGGPSTYRNQNSLITKRLRIHSIAQTCLTMLHADVFVYHDQKPYLFSPSHISVSSLLHAVFYTSREIKELGDEATPIRSSRMVGVLLNRSGIFVTYNCADSVIKLHRSYEMNTKIMFEMTLCHDRLADVYDPTDLHALMFGNDMMGLYALLADAEEDTRQFLTLDNGYLHFYYLTHDHHGDILLRLLSQPQLCRTLNAILLQGLAPAEAYSGYDALDEQDRPVLLASLPDFPKLIRFSSSTMSHHGSGHIICFDFQAEVMRRYFDPNVQIETIGFSKFEGRFFSPQPTSG